MAPLRATAHNTCDSCCPSALKETGARTELQPNERIVKEGAANLQKNIETVGGRLCPTDRRLVFEAHRINFQGDATESELPYIQSKRPCWSKFLGLIPLFSNSMVV